MGTGAPSFQSDDRSRRAKASGIQPMLDRGASQPFPQSTFDDRQSADAYRPIRHGHHGAIGECELDTGPHGLKQRGECAGVETFLAHTQNRRAALTARRKQCVEIRVERDADALIRSGSLQDVDVIGAAHPDFGYVSHVPAGLCEQRAG